jgi:hypothetical protein
MSRSQAQKALAAIECPSLESLYPDVRQDDSEPYSFWVLSSDGRNEYKVQLHLYNFNGWCGCQNYEFACWPELSRGAKPEDRLKCKHIKRARDFYLDKILRESQQQLQKQ